jgi:hypothetical protein
MTLTPPELHQLEQAYLLARKAYDADALVREYPPHLVHPNKQHLHQLTCPPDRPHRGTLVCSRYQEMPLPTSFPQLADHPVEHLMREDVFGYEPPAPGAVEWYLNFADEHLFFAYGGPLFAQDEMQVAEHPALASLREAIKASGVPGLEPFTRDKGRPTPVLVRGVERRCAVDTDPDLTAGRPYGLYGNSFQRAPVEDITRATTVLDPPTISNIIAMEAPPGGRGPYTMDQIQEILITAYTGFTAARIESLLASPGSPPLVVIHTGHWGTGAFGGNKVLMSFLQMLAACLAGIDRLTYHTHNPTGTTAYEGARRIIETKLLPSGGVPTEEVLGAIFRMGLQWGVSDGN